MQGGQSVRGLTIGQLARLILGQMGSMVDLQVRRRYTLTLQCVAVCCSVMQRVAAWRSVAQCVAVWCSVVQHDRYLGQQAVLSTCI